MSFVFAGTPDFGARVLRGLADLGRVPALVVSQPDRPRGRGRKTCPPPVIEEAARLGCPAMQVEDLNAPATISAMQATGADRLVVAAFGQLLREAVLERFLCLNVHASLLPKYRGAAPIERALAAGEVSTGISIMRMTVGLDEGPVALQTSVSIGLRDDAGSLGRALAVLGASGLDQVLTGLHDGTVVWTEQSEPGTYACKLTAADTLIDPSAAAKTVHDQVRALSPVIGVRARSGEVEFKVWRTWPYDGGEAVMLPPGAGEVQGVPGAMVARDGRLFLGCGRGVLEILLVQPAGKARMNTSAFLRGYGSRLADRLNLAREGTVDIAEPTAPGTAGGTGFAESTVDHTGPRTV